MDYKPPRCALLHEMAKSQDRRDYELSRRSIGGCRANDLYFLNGRHARLRRRILGPLALLDEPATNLRPPI
jgi:hypothetical protein